MIDASKTNRGDTFSESTSWYFYSLKCSPDPHDNKAQTLGKEMCDGVIMCYGGNQGLLEINYITIEYHHAIKFGHHGRFKRPQQCFFQRQTLEDLDHRTSSDADSVLSPSRCPIQHMLVFVVQALLFHQFLLSEVSEQ